MKDVITIGIVILCQHRSGEIVWLCKREKMRKKVWKSERDIDYEREVQCKRGCEW